MKFNSEMEMLRLLPKPLTYGIHSFDWIGEGEERQKVRCERWRTAEIHLSGICLLSRPCLRNLHFLVYFDWTIWIFVSSHICIAIVAVYICSVASGFFHYIGISMYRNSLADTINQWWAYLRLPNRHAVHYNKLAPFRHVFTAIRTA